MVFSLYELQDGGSPLWTESQNVELDDQGRYTALLGAAQPDGLPLDLFTSGKALWLGVQPQLSGIGELPRVLLVAVPYALKAADAETLGGRPASAYLTVESQSASSQPVSSEPVSQTHVAEGSKTAVGPTKRSQGGNGSSTGITSLNNLTASNQMFSTGTSGTDFNIVSSGSTHTYNLPDASPLARGLVTTGPQTFGGVKTFTTPIAPVSGGTGASNMAAAGSYLRGNGTAFVTSSVAAGGAGSCAANHFVTAANDNASPTCAQPAFTNLSGIASASQLPTASAASQGILQLSRDLTGTAAAPLVAGLQGYPVSNAPPAINQVLQWNGAAWAPASQLAGSYATLGSNTFTGTENIAGNLGVMSVDAGVVPFVVNTPSGQTADLVDLQVNGANVMRVGYLGNLISNSNIVANGGQLALATAAPYVWASYPAANFQIGIMPPGGSSVTGSLTLGIGDTTGVSGNSGSSTILRAGDATGATGANAGGNLTIRPGMVSSTAGTPGTLSISNVYIQGAAVTVGNLECFSGSNTVSDCGSGAANFAGVAIAKHGTASVDVQQLGVAAVNLANGATTGTTAGHFACTSSTAGQVVDSSSACPTGQTVGIVTDTQASSSSPTSVNVQIWHAEAAGGSGGGGGFTAAGDLNGSSTSQTVVALQSRPIANVVPSSGQVLAWSGSAWAPATPSSGGGAGTGTSGALPKWTSTTTLGNSPLSDSGSALTSSEAITAPSLSTNGSGAGAVQLSSGSTSVTWTLGVGAPAGTCSVGSLFSRTDGGTGSTLYVCQGPSGSWVAK